MRKLQLREEFYHFTTPLIEKDEKKVNHFSAQLKSR